MLKQPSVLTLLPASIVSTSSTFPLLSALTTLPLAYKMFLKRLVLPILTSEAATGASLTTTASVVAALRRRFGAAVTATVSSTAHSGWTILKQQSKRIPSSSVIGFVQTEQVCFWSTSPLRVLSMAEIIASFSWIDSIISARRLLYSSSRFV